MSSAPGWGQFGSRGAQGRAGGLGPGGHGAERAVWVPGGTGQSRQFAWEAGQGQHPWGRGG